MIHLINFKAVELAFIIDRPMMVPSAPLVAKSVHEEKFEDVSQKAFHSYRPNKKAG
jgi:hypothetical protein